jgi:hypothetical protein
VTFYPQSCGLILRKKYKFALLQELDSVNKLISEGKLKATEIRNNLKNLETTSTRFGHPPPLPPPPPPDTRPAFESLC